jgi:hypothetical protein
MSKPSTPLPETGAAQIHLGTIISQTDRSRVTLCCDQIGLPCLEAQVLYTTEEHLVLNEGDTVLFWVDTERPTDCVIIGRIGPSSSGGEETSDLRRQVTQPVAEVLVLEAKESLTLRVGTGSITIREDGKILIKGKDLVSHAQRMNRIKGGSVSIN